MTDVNIEDAEALVIARAVGRIVSQPHNFRSSTADIVHEYVVDGLVALVSEGWQLIPPGAAPDAERGTPDHAPVTDEELRWMDARLFGQTSEEATYARRLIAEVKWLRSNINNCSGSCQL